MLYCSSNTTAVNSTYLLASNRLSCASFSSDATNYITGVCKQATFTSMTIGDESGNSFASVTNIGTYQRLFNVVTIFFHFGWSGKGSAVSTNGVRISGFPYAFNSTYGALSITTSIAGTPGITYSNYITMSGVAGQTYAHMYKEISASSDVQVLVSDMAVTGNMYVTMTYCV